ncbi:hypothetical protein SAMN04488498_1575 [Mesorhizobium albiziae]|uniref:Uncharacterized protein n=1 Tax=Neomesorhizobium albiziae TaxID=335020 RepID=A0A1I4FRZ1_9HYPH|nr:hypothetical protein [Mesorhizobium albiziae]SFL20585.1 hypothetical protein SAMN04488498_1575 [Mesorhizobium albiziae]
MAIQRNAPLIHWNFFLALEDDLDRLSRFIDLSGNNDTYSIEIARLLLSASSEVDIVLKQLCKQIDSSSSASSIGGYFDVVSIRIPDFFTFQVTIPRHELTLTPWIDWIARETPPLWWSDHNKVKHTRHQNFSRANLKNCLNALAGLYISVLYLHRPEAEAGRLLGLPKLFNVSDAHFGGTQMGRFGNSFKYKF